MSDNEASKITGPNIQCVPFRYQLQVLEKAAAVQERLKKERDLHPEKFVHGGIGGGGNYYRGRYQRNRYNNNNNGNDGQFESEGFGRSYSGGYGRKYGNSGARHDRRYLGNNNYGRYNNNYRSYSNNSSQGFNNNNSGYRYNGQNQQQQPPKQRQQQQQQQQQIQNSQFRPSQVVLQQPQQILSETIPINAGFVEATTPFQRQLQSIIRAASPEATEKRKMGNHVPYMEYNQSSFDSRSSFGSAGYTSQNGRSQSASSYGSLGETPITTPQPTGVESTAQKPSQSQAQSQSKSESAATMPSASITPASIWSSPSNQALNYNGTTGILRGSINNLFANGVGGGASQISTSTSSGNQDASDKLTWAAGIL